MRPNAARGGQRVTCLAPRSLCSTMNPRVAKVDGDEFVRFPSALDSNDRLLTLSGK